MRYLIFLLLAVLPLTALSASPCSGKKGRERIICMKELKKPKTNTGVVQTGVVSTGSVNTGRVLSPLERAMNQNNSVTNKNFIDENLKKEKDRIEAEAREKADDEKRRLATERQIVKDAEMEEKIKNNCKETYLTLYSQKYGKHVYSRWTTCNNKAISEYFIDDKWVIQDSTIKQ